MVKTRKKRITTADNYIWLLLAMLVLFFSGAAAEQLGLHHLSRLTAMALMAVVLVAVWSLERDRWPFSSRVGVTLLFIIVEGANIMLDHYHLGTVQIALLLLFTVGTIVVACRQVLLTGAVDFNKIIGSICIYLLMGMAWAEAYLLVERIFPGSVPELSGANWREHVQDALYFSYISLTTLGYGDISPAQPLARYLAYMQAIVGQFYVAIVVASLIGARMSGDSRDEA
jgi:voltage-gated potassium channel